MSWWPLVMSWWPLVMSWWPLVMSWWPLVMIIWWGRSDLKSLHPEQTHTAVNFQQPFLAPFINNFYFHHCQYHHCHHHHHHYHHHRKYKNHLELEVLSACRLSPLSEAGFTNTLVDKWNICYHSQIQMQYNHFYNHFWYYETLVSPQFSQFSWSQCCRRRRFASFTWFHGGDDGEWGNEVGNNDNDIQVCWWQCMVDNDDDLQSPWCWYIYYVEVYVCLYVCHVFAFFLDPPLCWDLFVFFFHKFF